MRNNTVRGILTQTLSYERPNGTCLVFEAGTEVDLEVLPPGMTTDLSLNSQWEEQEQVTFAHDGLSFIIEPDEFKLVK